MSGRAYLNDRKHAVYVMWSDDTAVYVGMSHDWPTRFIEHGVWWPTDDQPLVKHHWILGDSLPITHIDVWEVDLNRADAAALELDLIRGLMPTHNRNGRPRKAITHAA